MRESIIIDTNLFIDWYKGRQEMALQLSQNSVCYLSSIVLIELMAGASTEAKRRDVERKKRMFASMDRIIYPNESISTKSGKCIQKMKVKSKHMLGDVIIAMTAKQIGATVWTTDKDFERIKESMDFKLRVFKGQ